MSSVKVIFVEPTGARSNIFARFMSIPLLGPVYLSTIAKQAGFDVSIINENILRRKITTSELVSADILCLSCITATIDRGKKIAYTYRALRAAKGKKSRVIVGGIHASMMPKDLSESFDQIIVGEAENIIVDILKGRITDHIVYGTKLDNLDTLPLPDYSLLQGWKGKGVVPVMTSRGCPYDCNFCSVTKMFGKGYRAQSPSRVLQETARFKQGRGFVFFVDDNFAVNFDRTNEILDGMVSTGFKRPWSAQVRTDVTHKPEFVAKMRKAGCKIVYVGFESINTESLLDMHKKQTVDDIRRSMEVFHKNNIMVHGMFILGNDPDTKELFKTTSRFCKEANIDWVQYSVLTPLPGTDLYARLKDEGRLLHKQWSYYDGLHVVFSPKNMTALELQKGMIECFSDFYSYANAINNALNAGYNVTASAVKALYQKVHFPSLYPTFVKFAGNGIVKQWVRENAPYLSYLSKSSARA
jgi:radical SAM superfamily enzyme YgiQ (UPF0313 family)